MITKEIELSLLMAGINKRDAKDIAPHIQELSLLIGRNTGGYNPQILIDFCIRLHYEK